MSQCIAHSDFSCLWEHDYVFPLTQTNLEHVLISDLHIATGLDPLSVQLRAITAFQIEKIGFYDILLLAPFICLHAVPELNDCMLAAGARVQRINVHDTLLPSDQPTGLGVQRYGVDDVISFEDIYAPRLGRRRFSCFGRLIVLQDDFRAGDGIRFFGEEAGGLKIRFLFFDGRIALHNVTAEGLLLRGKSLAGTWWW